MRSWAKIDDLKLKKLQKCPLEKKVRQIRFFVGVPNKNKGGHNNLSLNFSSSTQRQNQSNTVDKNPKFLSIIVYVKIPSFCYVN